MNQPVVDRQALLITGTVGVGKTSVADLLGDLLATARLPHAVIDLDRICQSWPPPETDPFNFRVLLRNLHGLTTVYRDAGARRIVLAGVAESVEQRHAYEMALGIPLQVCRLTAEAASVRARLTRRHKGDGDSNSRRWHLGRAGELDRILDRADVADFTIDTTHLTLPAVAAAVLTATAWA
ncbi:hypothetical protein [Streptomyces sp. NPDC058401]|uniref:hypothetical protein n=1 Tax=Streptomyces sp. NPDC058401 TaxID=3346480 RepID=UPI00365CAAB3